MRIPDPFRRKQVYLKFFHHFIRLQYFVTKHERPMRNKKYHLIYVKTYKKIFWLIFSRLIPDPNLLNLEQYLKYILHCFQDASLLSSFNCGSICEHLPKQKQKKFAGLKIFFVANFSKLNHIKNCWTHIFVILSIHKPSSCEVPHKIWA